MRANREGHVQRNTSFWFDFQIVFQSSLQHFGSFLGNLVYVVPAISPAAAGHRQPDYSTVNE